MTKLTRNFVTVLTGIAAACSCAAQTGAAELWRTYLAAGASALEAGNLPEAESFYTAAATQMEHASSKEPYFTIAKYSLAATLWEEGNQDEAIKTFKSLNFTLNPSGLSVQTRESIDTLLTLGNHFYSAAEAKKKEVAATKLAADALQKANDDISIKYSVARRYYQWVYVMDRQFLPVHSSDMENIAADYGLASFYAADYPDAKEAFTDLLEIVRQSTRRQTELSHGSMANSLAGGSGAGPAKADLSEAAICVLLSVSDEAIADDIAKDKPAEAVQDYAQAESHLTAYVRDPTYGKTARTVLERLYGKHADLLRHSGQTTQAALLAVRAKDLQRSKD